MTLTLVPRRSSDNLSSHNVVKPMSCDMISAKPKTAHSFKKLCFTSGPLPNEYLPPLPASPETLSFPDSVGHFFFQSACAVASA